MTKKNARSTHREPEITRDDVVAAIRELVARLERLESIVRDLERRVGELPLLLP